MFRFTQTRFYWMASVLGLSLYLALFAGITGGVVWLAGVAGYMLTIVVFAIFAWGFEPNPKLRPLYHRGQSYLFMAGPVLAPTMFMVSAETWHYYGDMAPPFLRSWWWFAAGSVVIWGFGRLFRSVDHERYIRKHAKLMLRSPSKWWLDRWQMPVSVAVIVTAVLPTWYMPGPAKWLTSGLVVICAVLAAIDGARDLDPFEQHIRWSVARFEPY